jgi:hypothetical protein
VTRTGSSVRLVALIVAVLLAAAAVWWLLGGRQAEQPLGFDYNGRVVLSQSGLSQDEPVTYGFIVDNSADEPARLRGVELVGDTEGVDAGPVLTAPAEGRTGSIASARGFPPSTEGLGVDLVPLDRSVVPAHSDVGPDVGPSVGVQPPSRPRSAFSGLPATAQARPGRAWERGVVGRR